MSLLDIFFPKRCVGCNKQGDYFCRKCRPQIRYTTHQICPMCGSWAIDGATHPRCKTRYALDGLTSFFHYDGIVKKAVKFLKYRFVSDLTDEFISLIPSSSLQSTIRQLADQQSAILIPVPLHPSRHKFRGFNQAEILGKILARKLSIPVKPNILKRIKKTVPQVEMKDRKKRLVNMEGVFSANQLSITNDQSLIILFDDVFTTGATLRAAANILKRAGVKRVWGVVMAHG